MRSRENNKEKIDNKIIMSKFSVVIVYKLKLNLKKNKLTTDINFHNYYLICNTEEA